MYTAHRRSGCQTEVTYHAHKRQSWVFDVPGMQIHPWKAAIGFLDPLLHMRQVGQAECVSGTEDNVVNIVQMRAILEVDPARLRVKTDNFLLHYDVRVGERRPAEGGNGIAPQRCVDRLLCEGENLMQDLVGRDRAAHYHHAL